MNKTKFTPGPWTVGGNGGFINQLQIHPTIGCAYGAGDEVKANAHLIAAAPDLYEALEDLICLCEVGLKSDYDINAELADARTALAKARGEA
jgi:hypothetical protein